MSSAAPGCSRSNAGIAVAPEALDRLAPQVTRLLIDERLRLQEVQRRRLPVTDADVADAVGELEKRNNLPAGALQAAASRRSASRRACCTTRSAPRSAGPG